MLLTPPLSALSSIIEMEGCQWPIWPEKRRRRRKNRGVYETEKSWRTDWLLGKAFCHMRTPPPLRPSPVIQALSVKDTQTDSPENLGSRLSQLSSRLIKVSYASSIPPHFFLCRMLNTLCEWRTSLRVQHEDLPLATNKKINSYDLETNCKEKLQMQIWCYNANV